MSGPLPWRGVVEGFYGPPWSHRERTDYFQFAGASGLDRYVYAPKDDPYHRERWRDPYPASELALMADLARSAAESGVTLVYAIAPGLSMRFSDDDEHAALAAKCAQLLRAGITSFSLLFDDVAAELADERDVAAFGEGAAGAGRAHGATCRRFVDDFLVPNGIHEPLLMCPTDYAGVATSAYRTALAETLPDDARVFWTGADIVVAAISRHDIELASASYSRDIVIWDNFPVNDFDRSRLFLGPLSGRETNLSGTGLCGIASNPMVEAAASRFALSTVALWAADPAGYDATTAAGLALTAVAGDAEEGLSALVSACSSWPPSASPSAEIARLVDEALDGVEASRRELALRMDALARTDDSQATPALRRSLGPWVRAARDTGRSGWLAARLLGALAASDGTDDVAVLVADTRDAAHAADSHFANVLRSIVPDFVAAVLRRADGDPQKPASAGPRATLLVGQNPVPGDRELAEFLRTLGIDASLETTAGDADLLVVSPGASPSAVDAARATDVPLIAWGHLVRLGMAAEASTELSVDSIEIATGGGPLAAGLSGRTVIYRGPAKLTWGTASPGGTVVASTTAGGRPVIVHYAAGSRLPDGTIAPAQRLTFFLGSDGFAPWLVTDSTRALFRSAVMALLGLDQ